MPKTHNPPTIKKTAFECPHCGAYTSQTWYRLFADLISENGVPGLNSKEDLEQLANSNDREITERIRRSLQRRIEKLLSGLVLLGESDNGVYLKTFVNNLHLSRCYNCREVSVWIFDRLVFPLPGEGPPPNEDLPINVRSDYEEASKILNLSPRGCAAMLRLAIQKLCIQLGEKGKNIDDDIASLVKKGLPIMVQQALDAVRVIGNEAVHPGRLDLKDDKDTAMQLFSLINIITEQMISNPKHVKEIYNKIPESKRKAIEERDQKDK